MTAGCHWLWRARGQKKLPIGASILVQSLLSGRGFPRQKTCARKVCTEAPLLKESGQKKRMSQKTRGGGEWRRYFVSPDHKRMHSLYSGLRNRFIFFNMGLSLISKIQYSSGFKDPSSQKALLVQNFTTWCVNPFCGIIWATFFFFKKKACNFFSLSQCSRFLLFSRYYIKLDFVSIIIKMWSVSVTKHTFQGS